MFLDLKLILPFACLGMILGLRMFRKTAWLYWAVISFSASLLLFFVASRYRMVILPFLFIFAGFGVFSFWEVIKSKKFMRFGASLVLLIVFFILFSLKASPFRKSPSLQGTSGDFDAHFYKAVLYDKLGKYQQELAELKIADQLVPGNAKVVFSYGLIFAHQGDFKSAEDYFKRAITISPFYVNAYYNLGFIYNQQKKFIQAKQILESAVFLNPDDLGSHFELAKAENALGNRQEAKKEFEFVLKTINPWRKEDIALIKKELAALH
jgi:tetratricopeptide (TPR) repeat protein